MFTLQNSINFARTLVEYAPLNAGLGNEPAVSIASMIRNSMLNAPMTWYFNRNTATFPTVVGQQDYARPAVLDLAFVETVSLQDDQGQIWEIKDVYNNAALSPSSVQQRPSAMSVETSDSTNGCLFRFLGVPDQIYTVIVTYQKLAPQFGPFFITSVNTAIGGNTVYNGGFNVLSFPVGSTAVVNGLLPSASPNNGSFTVVAATTTQLTLANQFGIAAANQSGFVSNFSWAPIPDQYSDVYNNLFLAEVLAVVYDPRAQLYRQRGVGALMAKATGLSDMQKNVFAQQWLARNTERAAVAGIAQLGNTGRGI